MDGVNNNRGIGSQYGVTTRQVKIGESFAATLSSVSPASGLDTTSTGSLTDNLNAALRAYGIQVPPSLRISASNGKLSLDGDARNNAFQKMLKDQPDLGNQLNGLLSSTQMQRKTALDAAMAAFGGDSPSASMQNFLDDFAQADKSTAFSIKFNGADATVEERGDNGWQKVSDQKSFMGELIAAYVKYTVAHGVTSVDPDKKDSQADQQLKQALAEKKAAS
ncbi:MAG TPA: hypothetical protein VN114_06480 [Oxalicibacterium sp.]|uniref:hypothetical protein n=1 Tax=Oxalicibacterium sp. TaxID=2766525 RepID=UPI002C5F51E6|nr:hypothetical protein [Oxalicibacterium sp.]HWU98141.1 hypothetical protein [Oxalicibacterium sp.]